MQMSKLQSSARMIATFGMVGNLPFARIWVSLLGVLFVLLGQSIFTITSMAGWIILGIVVGSMLGISAYVRTWFDKEKESEIVLDRVAGVIVSLLFLSKFTIKFTLFGFTLFHVWLFVSMLAQRVYGYNNKVLEGPLVLSTGEIALIAVFTNIVLHALWWITH